MRKQRLIYFVGLGLLGLGLTASVNAQEVKGMITSRTGDTLTVKGDSGSTVVVLTESTQTVDRKGLFGLDKEQLGATVLIPGLKVKVEGSQDDQGRLVAKTITTDGDDLETAEMIEAGLTPTAEQVQKNIDTIESHHQQFTAHKEKTEADISATQQNVSSNKAAIEENVKDIQANYNRFATLDDYDVKGTATVKFAVGSTKISKEDEEQLKQLAQTAANTPGVLIEVMGYADSTGHPEMNTVLSEKRAKAVITFLIQQGGIPVRHIVAPGAMGEYGNVAPNETKAGRAENRRVEVKILSNKGVAGSTT
jgi:outer membrane protein OmpA-like peptidoglycan-associated protein